MEKSDNITDTDSVLPPDFHGDHTGFRDGYLFIIDSIPAMLTTDMDETCETYFEQCIQSYARILSEKLSWNRRDWMGLVLFGVNRWDMDPETKHVLTLQKFGEITTEMLSQVKQILENVDEYKEISTECAYPLHDVLWQAARAFDSVKVHMTSRQVILATCRDNPFSNDQPERHRIRLRAKTFGDINVNLRILGLGEHWNHQLFYRDLVMLANNTELGDIKPTSLEDIEVQIRFPAKTIDHLELEIAEGLLIRTALTHFSGTTKYLKQFRLAKETNEVLDRYTHYGNPQSLNKESDEETEDPPEPFTVYKAVKYGNKTIVVRPRELGKIRMPCPPGIRLVGFKKISLDLKYHISPVKFVGLEPLPCDEEEQLFTGLLNECHAKKVMAICSVSHRGGPYLAKMIPSVQHGGFYLYRIAYFEQVHDLHNYVKTFINGGEQTNCTAINEAGVALMKKIAKKLRIRWNPRMFLNPKLQTQFAYMRTLALDGVAELVHDTTLPPREEVNRRLEKLTPKFMDMFASLMGRRNKRKPSGKTKENVAKISKFDNSAVQQLIDDGKLEQCTALVLRSMAYSLGATTSGTKADLIKKIMKYYALKKRG